MQRRDLEFLYEIASLRFIPRAWIQHLGVPVASTLEHTIRVIYLSLLIAHEEGVKKSDEKIIKMALVHDAVEARTADLAYVHKVYSKQDEKRAASDMFSSTSFGDLHEYLKLYEKRDSIEAKIVKDADNLDIDLELMELEEQGSKLPPKLRVMRKMVRNKKLYTKTAKKMWDAIQKSDPAAWHLKSNKWYKVPSAGR